MTVLSNQSGVPFDFGFGAVSVESIIELDPPLLEVPELFKLESEEETYAVRVDITDVGDLTTMGIRVRYANILTGRRGSVDVPAVAGIYDVELKPGDWVPGDTLTVFLSPFNDEGEGPQTGYQLLFADASFANITAPQLTSADNYIGTVPTYVVGTWSGSPSLSADLMKNGVILAAGISPGPLTAYQAAEDGSSLYVLEWAVAGSLTLSMPSNSRTITYAPPTLSAIADQSFVEGSGPHTIDAGALATGAGLTWSVVGPVTISVVGVISVDATALSPQVDTPVTVTVKNSGAPDGVSRTFLLDITPVPVTAPGDSGVVLPDLFYVQNSTPNPRTFDASVGFTGPQLVYTIVTPITGVSINASTCVISVATGALLSPTTLTIRATNSANNITRSVNVGVFPAVTPWWHSGAVFAYDRLNSRYMKLTSGAGVPVEYTSIAQMVSAGFFTDGTPQIVDISSVYTAGNPFTVVAQGVCLGDAAFATLVAVDDGDDADFADNRVELRKTDQGFAGILVDANSVRQYDVTHTVNVLGQRTRMGASISNGSNDFTANTTAAAHDALGTIPPGLTHLVLGGKRYGTHPLGSMPEVVEFFLGSKTSAALTALVGNANEAPWETGVIIPDQLNLIQGSGPLTVPSAPSFGGTITAYSITGAGVSMNASSGLITIPKTSLQAQQTVTPRATNGAFGFADTTFRMSVIAGSNPVTTVTTVAELLAAWLAASDGDIIEVTGGNKAGNITRTGGLVVPNVTIRPADRGNPPVFKGVTASRNGLLSLTNCSGFTLDGLHFDSDAPPVRTSFNPFLLRFVGCADYKVTDCYFRDYYGAIDVYNATNIEICYNTLQFGINDHLRVFQRIVNGKIHHNEISDTLVNLAWQQDTNWHPDFIQFACTNPNLGCNNVEIDDNHISTIQTATDQHGIFMLSERVTKDLQPLATYGHVNMKVRRNFVQAPHPQGIFFGGVNGATIEFNTLRRPPGGSTLEARTPQFYAGQGVGVNANITVKDNVGPPIPPATTLKYGIGEQGPITKINNVASNTAFPPGWSGFDVALGRYGQYAPR